MSGLLVLFALAASAATERAAVVELERGYRAFVAGQYGEAARALDGLAARLPRSGDYALYLAAESGFYSGAPARARALFEALARKRASRFAAMAPWRAADCLWAEGRRPEAVAAYRLLVGARGVPVGVDPVVARFRIAELASASEQPRLFRQIHSASPAHPLAELAARRTGDPVTSGRRPLTPAFSPADRGEGDRDEGERGGELRGGEGKAPAGSESRERLQRAALLAEDRHYDAALAELDRLPAQLSAELALERDFQRGMAKYRMRRDYAEAGKLLLGIAPHLTGEKAAFAQFHGARALSRADRDDEAIVEYRKVVERYPGSHWAPEAQFRSGWLDFIRGRYREALPGLRATLARFGHSPFANDAAWFVFFAHFLLDEPAQALPALEQYGRLSGSDPEAGRRLLYWRARTLARMKRDDEARDLLRECVRRWPLDHYGVLARARLRASRELLPPPLPQGQRAPAHLPARGAADRDPAVERADELAGAGLVADAGLELERGEDGLTRRVGRDAALAVLLDRYPRLQGYRRARQLAETRGAAALGVAPAGDARLVWEAAYPRAYADLVEPQAPRTGNPEYFLYAIMLKESGFSPHEVSYADARGLLQLIPARGQDMAAELGEPFHPDELYEPATNVRLGARYIGSLVRKFGGQIFLAAAAYNGGLKPTMRWCDQYAQHPFDEFIELIAYDQTREYVKRVIGIYAHYLYLYRGTPYEPPLTVDARYAKDPP
jgi:soluble lytic murein transglycosylase